MDGDDLTSQESNVNNHPNSNMRNRAGREPITPGMCGCGLTPTLMTSWTRQNPGRRFWRCARPAAQQCAYFHWEDPEVCARARAIIPGLLRRVNRLEATVRDNNRRMKKLVFLLAISWIWVLALLMY